MPKITTNSGRYLGQEVHLQSFAMMYPKASRTLDRMSIKPDRVLAIRAGLKSGPIVGHIAKSGARYYWLILRDLNWPIISSGLYGTIGCALENLINWQHINPKDV